MKNLPVFFAAGALALAVAPLCAEEVTYTEHVQPLFEVHCAGCHGVNAPYVGDFDADKDRYEEMGLGPRMDSYADLIMFVVYPDTGALMRRLDDGSSHPEGKPGNMHEHLGADDDERQRNLAVSKAWVGDDAWNLERWGDITKEQLDRLELAY